MSNLGKFIEQIPALCDAPFAAARGMRNKLVFEYELANPDSVFSYKEFVEEEDRLEVLFDFPGDEKKKKYCKDLLLLKMYTGYAPKYPQRDYKGLIEDLEISLYENEIFNVPITDVYSIDEAKSVEAPGWID